MRILLATLLLLFAVAVDALPRDRNQVNAFKREHPCPVTGRPYGACPGHQVDHIKPLKCGGADRPWNMQWLTIRAHQAKTKREAKSCRKPR